MFYGREEQRKRLSDMINAQGQVVSLIYGRRRVGKSELIKQADNRTEQCGQPGGADSGKV